MIPLQQKARIDVPKLVGLSLILRNYWEKSQGGSNGNSNASSKLIEFLYTTGVGLKLYPESGKNLV